MNNITKQFLKVKISLILIISTCFLPITFAQQRITDFNNGGTKVVTFLSQYNNDNYIITVTPEDEVSFYLLNEENEKELIRQVIIPFAYITKNDVKLVKEKYFMLFSDAEIYNYDFISNTVVTYPINNPLPSNYVFGVYDKDQEGVRFSLNGTQYIYYYRENRLETSSLSVIEKYKEHLIMYNGSEYFYSNNYGVDKRFLLKTSSKIISYVSAFEQYALAIDSTGLVLRFNYSGSTDTLFAVTRPITIGNRKVLETKDYIIACTGTSQDSSYIDFYRKNNLEFVNSIRLNEGIRIRKNHILQEGSSVIFYDSRGKFTIFYPESKKTYRHNRVKFNDFDKFFISNNKILLYKYTGTDYNITALDISNFSEKILYRTEENIYDYRSDNFWLKNGNLYYYNKPGYNDKDQITLFSFDAFFNAFYPVVTESLSAGVDRKHKLINVKDKIYLCTNDLYEIEGLTYTKLNGKKLLPLLLYSDSYYKIENEKIIYAEENGNNKDIYVISNGIKFKIFTKEKSYSIKEIATFGNYLFVVDWMNDLFIVDIQSQSIEVLEDRIDYLPGRKPVFEDGKYLYFFTFEGLHLYDPGNKIKKLLSPQSLDSFYPFMIFKGKTHFIFSDKICVLDDNLNLKVLPTSDDYDVMYHIAVQDDKLFYFIARQNNTYFLFKFDGTSSTKIFEGTQLYLSSLSADILVFSVHDQFGLFLESKVYDNKINQVYTATTKNDVSLQQVFRYKNDLIGLFHTFDSLFIVKYNNDFTSFEVLHSGYDPFELNSNILGTITNDRVLVSTGREFLYITHDLHIYKLKPITPNNEYRQIILRDSMFYFMAIGNPLGNQVYSFNHEEFERLTQLENVSNTSNEIFVFPNPASDYLYIRNELKSEITSYDYTIINTIGETILTGTLQNENQIRIDHFCSGIYYIIFNLNNIPSVSQFMKQ